MKVYHGLDSFIQLFSFFKQLCEVDTITIIFPMSYQVSGKASCLKPVN